MNSDAISGPARDAGSSTYSAPSPLAQRTRHPTLWFEDGNVILATQDVLFRVYRGILSRHSLVFRDMFSFPQHASEERDDNETMDGLPVVHLTDDAKEFEHLLETIHGHSYYSPGILTDCSVVAAILRLSTKYQIDRLREQSLTQLATRFPDTLEAYQNPTKRSIAILHPDFTHLISIFRETRAVQLLPVAFYEMATYFLPTAMESEAFSFTPYPSPLSSEDLTRVFFGREKMRQALHHAIGKFIYAPSAAGCLTKASDECSRLKHVFLRSELWLAWDGDPTIFDITLFEEIQDNGDLLDLCKVCRNALRRSMKEGTHKAWEKLPTFFGLDNWETLRCITAASSADA